MASYGAAAYICYSTDARLVMAKNQVAPLKKLTLPHLELMAALIGARLGSHLQKSLMVTDITYWSDSQIVLHWLKSSKPTKKFTTNRVSEISNLTPGSSWRYCPTDSNPADLLTREGVDFTGAIQTKNNTGTKSKAYICLFTCAATRAIHLEVVTDLSESTFLQAFKRFVSRKSLPKIMISDNATTYQSAAISLRNLFQSASIRTSLSEMGTEWRFIPKRAPWYGGFWERLIGLTKVTLKKIIGRAYVTLETLQTITTEAECMINNRPLTHVPSSPDDPRPLTPAHLLYGRQTTSLPYSNDIDATNCEVTSDHTSLTKQARMQQTLIDHFRRRWMSEYLTALREHHQKTGCNAQTIKVGDVVLIHDDSPRIRWKLGLVDELLTGMDGLTRAVKLRTTTGVTSQPIVKLYPLEVGSVPTTDDITDDV